MPREIADQKTGEVISQEPEGDDYLYEDDQPEDDDGGDGWEECGRWDNGKLMFQCRKAGSEECDWECPIGLPRR